jgi:hypothetical protein
LIANKFQIGDARRQRLHAETGKSDGDLLIVASEL